MRSNGAHRLLIAVIGFAVFASVLPAPAHADRFSYCGVAVSSGSWCGRNDVNHSYYGQDIIVQGGTTTWERMLRDNTSSVRPNGPYSAPGNNILICYTGAGMTQSQFEAEARHTGGGSKLVAASAYYGSTSPYLQPCLV